MLWGYRYSTETLHVHTTTIFFSVMMLNVDHCPIQPWY